MPPSTVRFWPLGRLGAPRTRDACVFLASDLSRITGQNLTVDGACR